MNELLLYGTVGGSFWDEEYFTAKQVREDLIGRTGPLTVRINSGGGIATEGQAIYTALRGYDGPVTVVIEGIAASAASLIAMAGDEIKMSLGAILMIHDPATWYVEGRGTEKDHLDAAKGLGVIANAYAGIYAKRAGISVDEAREIMQAETYFDGPAALEAGFATHVDDDGDQADIAAFDYRLYAKAPDSLRAAAGSVPRRRSTASALAMMARASLPKSSKGKDMPPSKLNPKAKITAKTANDEDDTEMSEEEEAARAAQEEEEEEKAKAKAAEEGDGDGDDDEEDDPEAEEEDEPKASISAVAIINMCARHGADAGRAADFIARGMNTQQVYVALTGKGANKVNINGKGPSARITRDEVETRRAGIEQALVARMDRSREVRGPGRDYMGLSIAEMAATSMGNGGRLARGGGELRAIEMAFGSHSTSDFPAIFENAMNKRLASAYQAAEPVYRMLAERLDFADFRPHPIAQIGDFMALDEVPESGEIKYGTVSDKKESVTLVAYAKAFRISRQMMVNDDLQAIDRLLSTRGRAVAAFEDAVFFKMLLSGANVDGPTLLETSRQIFNTTDGTKAATAAGINPTSIAKGYEAMRSRKGVGGETYLPIQPSLLLTGPAKEFEALQLLAPIQAAQASNVNPYVGKLQPIVSPYISGNAWHMLASPSDAPSFMYGYLQGEEGPRMRMDEPFGQQGMAFSVELDFGVGATDYRGVYKNAGA